jgi:LuxR family maltose regulon positive regulatory protein
MRMPVKDFCRNPAHHWEAAMNAQPEFCRSMICNQDLLASFRRPASQPWPIKVHILGGFRLERDGSPLDLGHKTPTRTLDILRVLAISQGHTCPIECLQDWLWPDLDGDQARAACGQALHRLRKLLGRADVVVQREGKLRLAADKVWVDLVDWEARLEQALAANAGAGPELEQLLFNFPGPLLLHERIATWCLPAAERVRRDVIELAIRIGKHCEARNDAAKARTVYLRALDFYPDSATIYSALIQGRIVQGDLAGAIDDYASCERTLRASGDGTHPSELRTLLQLLLASLVPQARSAMQTATYHRRDSARQEWSAPVLKLPIPA